MKNPSEWKNPKKGSRGNSKKKKDVNSWTLRILQTKFEFRASNFSWNQAKMWFLEFSVKSKPLEVEQKKVLS